VHVHATSGRSLLLHGNDHAEGPIIPERKLLRPRALPVPNHNHAIRRDTIQLNQSTQSSAVWPPAACNTVRRFCIPVFAVQMKQVLDPIELLGKRSAYYHRAFRIDGNCGAFRTARVLGTI